METVISAGIISFTFLVIIYVEKLMYRKSLTDREIRHYQKVLNEMDANAKARYNLVWEHDAKTELMEQRKQRKFFILILSGIFLAFVLTLLVFLNSSFIDINIVCISSIVLVCYGFTKIVGSRKIIIEFLSIVIVAGVLLALIFDVIMSPYIYIYFFGAIVLLGIISLMPKKLKKA